MSTALTPTRLLPAEPNPQTLPDRASAEEAKLRSDGLLKSAKCLLPELCRLCSAAASCSPPKTHRRRISPLSEKHSR